MILCYPSKIREVSRVLSPMTQDFISGRERSISWVKKIRNHFSRVLPVAYHQPWGELPKQIPQTAGDDGSMTCYKYDSSKWALLGHKRFQANQDFLL